jgi:hypothetical protein
MKPRPEISNTTVVGSGTSGSWLSPDELALIVIRTLYVVLNCRVIVLDRSRIVSWVNDMPGARRYGLRSELSSVREVDYA